MPPSTGPIGVIRLAAMAPKPILKDPSFHKMLASLAQTFVVGFLVAGELDRHGRHPALLVWVEVGGGWSAVGVAECGAQRSEDVYFPGQVQGVWVGGSYPGDRPVWGGGGR